MDLKVIHSLILLLLISICVASDNPTGCSCFVQCDDTCNLINCIKTENCCTEVDSCPQSLELPSDCKCHQEHICNTMINCCQQNLCEILRCILSYDCRICDDVNENNISTSSESVEISVMTHVDCNSHQSCEISHMTESCASISLHNWVHYSLKYLCDARENCPEIKDCQVSVDVICGSTTITNTEIHENPACPTSTIASSPSGSGPNTENSMTDSTSSTSTTTLTPSNSEPDELSAELTDKTSTSHMTDILPSSGSTSSESSTSGVTSSPESAAAGSPVTVTVLICLAVLFVVVMVVAGFFLWRRKRRADDVRKENNPSCLSVATNLHPKQDSFHVYDHLSRENKRTSFGNASTAAANSRDNDNNDDYTYIDGPAINKGVVRLHQDRPVTTDGQLALTDPSVSGLQPDLSSTYRLARPIDNNIPDSQPPDYFNLEEREKKGCAEPTEYFVLEERGEKKSPADTDTQQYFILEERQEGGGRESAPKHMSSRSEADYFVLENDEGQQRDCAVVARSDASRGPPEEAEYSRLDPNICQESEYTLLSRPPQSGDTRGDNPYCLASYPE